MLKSSGKAPVSAYPAWPASTASPSRSCPRFTISSRSTLWNRCAGSLRLRPVGEKAAMTPLPSALSNSSDSELKYGK